jgi:hypothetical protein
MGVDLRIVIAHKLTSKEIIEFPYLVNRSKELKDVYMEEIQSKIDYNGSIELILSNLDKEYNWENYTESDLLNSWENNENPELVDENGYMAHSLDTYFGLLYFNRQTVEILYLPEHKYANLNYMSNRKFIFNFSRAFAKFLGSEKIVYFSDTFLTEIVENWALEGLTIESIIDLAIAKFGAPSKILAQAIEKRLIIEDIGNPYVLE